MRFVAGVAAAFGAGVIFASSLDFTPFGHAQSGNRPKEIAAAKPLTDQGNAFVAIAERVTPAVVSIQAERDQKKTTTDPRLRGQRQAPPGLEDFFNQLQPRGQQAPQESSGSGFIVTADGYILTNNHVVEGADRLTVNLTDRRSFKGRVIGRDPTTDVAVIKIDGTNLPTVALGQDELSRVGEWVLAIGNPLGLDFTVTAGIVSAKGRGANELRGINNSPLSISDFIQTDAAINPGNSGGPLVNTRGEVIGINSAIASQTGFYSGYGFAIPITLAKSVMDDIIKHGRVRRAILGITIQEIQPADAAVAGLKDIRGVKVGAYNADDSPAKRAGIEEGDVIVKADGRDADRVSALQRIVRAHAPGETIDVEIMRFGARKTFKVRLAEAPGDETVARVDAAPKDSESGASIDKLGVTVEPVSTEFAQANDVAVDRRGVRVAVVTPGGPSWKQLYPNDIIFEVIYPVKATVHSLADLTAALGKVDGGTYVSVKVLSIFQSSQGVQHQTRIVNLKLGGQ